MKLYKKSELEFRNGMIIAKDGEVINVDPQVTVQANLLETKMQAQAYLDMQPKAQPMPTLEGFERKSNVNKKIKIRTHTPRLDQKAKDAEKIMDEIEASDACRKIEDMASNFKELIAWVESDEVLAMDATEQVSIFDTPTLGNPLTLDGEDIIAGITVALGLGADELIADEEDDE